MYEGKLLKYQFRSVVSHKKPQQKFNLETIYKILRPAYFHLALYAI